MVVEEEEEDEEVHREARRENKKSEEEHKVKGAVKDLQRGRGEKAWEEEGEVEIEGEVQTGRD